MVSGRAAALLEENIMNPTVCTHKNNPNFWIFGLFFFLYFFIMATCFPFLPIWLSDVIGLNKTETGLVFSSLSLFAICFQPILGVISDKLGLKKHLMWIVTVLLVLIAPFFLYVFAPLLKTNIWLGALSGGAYIGFAFSAGAGAMEAYIERVSRNSGFEYGKARTFGCLGWALCATTAGMLFSINPEWVFWMGSAAALLLVVLGMFMYLQNSASQVLYMDVASQSHPGSLNLAASLNSMSFNIGIALGSAVGGLINGHFGLMWLGPVGALFLVCAIAITTFLRPFVAQERDFYADI